MIYGYIRVSTDHQHTANQRHEIETFIFRNDIKVDKWVEEVISSRKPLHERRLGKILKKLKKGDILIATELSRLGRNLLEVMGILQECLEKDCQIWTLKENYRLGADIQSKVLAFAFGLSAEIERNLISQRTKEALERRKREGIKLGRPKGKQRAFLKLDGAEIGTTLMLLNGISINRIANLYGVHRNTVKEFIKRKDLLSENNVKKVIALIG